MKKILYLGPDKHYENSGLHLATRNVITKLIEKGYPIDVEEVSSTKNDLLLPLVGALAAVRILLKSKDYSLVILFGETFANHVYFVMQKSIVFLHHLPEMEKAASESNSNFLGLIKYNYRKKVVHSLNKCKAIITSTLYNKDSFTNCCRCDPKKIHLIRSPIELNVYMKKEINKSAFLSRYGVKESKKAVYLLYVGSETSRKNFILILKALALLNKEQFHLIKIGNHGSTLNRNNHSSFIKKHRLNVSFIEAVNEEELVGFYNIADLYINPSLFEGFGRTPLEAQACGLPVISSDCGALKEVLGDSAYILKNPKDARELKEAILNMLDDEALRESYTKKGFENVKRFSLEKQVQAWENLLLSLGDTNNS